MDCVGAGAGAQWGAVEDEAASCCRAAGADALPAEAAPAAAGLQAHWCSIP